MFRLSDRRQSVYFSSSKAASSTDKRSKIWDIYRFSAMWVILDPHQYSSEIGVLCLGFGRGPALFPIPKDQYIPGYFLPALHSNFRSSLETKSHRPWPYRLRSLLEIKSYRPLQYSFRSLLEIKSQRLWQYNLRSLLEMKSHLACANNFRSLLEIKS